MILGLSGESMTRLMANEPIVVNTAQFDLAPLRIVLVGGPDENAIVARLKEHDLLDDSGAPDVTLPPTTEQVSAALCREAVQRYRSLDITATGAVSARLNTAGEVTGLSVALCHLHGWDPAVEAGEDGKAGNLITAWWTKHYPEDWSEDVEARDVTP
jgi:hypothetical protein